MKINKDNELKEIDVKIDGVKNIKKRILIGPEDGSDNIVMRYFRIMPQGHTPHHKHDYEHVIKIEKGKGIAIDNQGCEHNISSGMSLFITANEPHQLRNPFDEPLEVICIIRNVEEIAQKIS